MSPKEKHFRLHAWPLKNNKIVTYYKAFASRELSLATKIRNTIISEIQKKIKQKLNKSNKSSYREKIRRQDCNCDLNHLPFTPYEI